MRRRFYRFINTIIILYFGCVSVLDALGAIPLVLIQSHFYIAVAFVFVAFSQTACLN